MRQVRFPALAVSGRGAANEHRRRLQQKARGRSPRLKYYGTTFPFWDHPLASMRVSKAPQVKNRQTEWDFDKDGLDDNPLDLIERDLIVAPIVETCGARAFVIGHLLRDFELAAI